jgi:hypothetical protein
MHWAEWAATKGPRSIITDLRKPQVGHAVRASAAIRINHFDSVSELSTILLVPYTL